MKPDELADKLVPEVREAGPLALLKAAVNERIAAAVQAERERAKAEDEHRRLNLPSSEPDSSGLVHYQLTGSPDVVEECLEAIRATAEVGIVGRYTEGDLVLIRRAWASGAKEERERCVGTADAIFEAISIFLDSDSQNPQIKPRIITKIESIIRSDE